MHKPLSATLIFAIALAGCTAFHQSPTWKKVTENRADRVVAKSSYADHLHQVLASENVEHKVVTYQFRYHTRRHEEAVGTGTAVLYRDAATPDSPWWLMDDHLGFPFWLPNEPVEGQMKFYLQRNAEILAQQEYPAGDVSKSLAGPTEAEQRAAFLARARKPVPKLYAKAKAKAAPSVVVADASEDEVKVAAKYGLNLRPARFAAKTPRTGVDAAAANTSVEAHFDEIFRTTHGTTYDPGSSLDREKMAKLRQALGQRGAETQAL